LRKKKSRGRGRWKTRFSGESTLEGINRTYQVQDDGRINKVTEAADPNVRRKKFKKP